MLLTEMWLNVIERPSTRLLIKLETLLRVIADVGLVIVLARTQVIGVSSVDLLLGVLTDRPTLFRDATDLDD